MREAMGDERGLERHHRSMAGQRPSDLVCDREEVVHGWAFDPNHSRWRRRASDGVAANNPWAPQSSIAKLAATTPCSRARFVLPVSNSAAKKPPAKASPA